MSDEPHLLKCYLAERSDTALEQIIKAYGGMVYAAARRQVADEHLADDVVQAVFLLLMRKAPTLTADHHLPGWLIRTTHFVRARSPPPRAAAANSANERLPR